VRRKLFCNPLEALNSDGDKQPINNFSTPYFIDEENKECNFWRARTLEINLFNMLCKNVHLAFFPNAFAHALSRHLRGNSPKALILKMFIKYADQKIN